MALMLVTGGGGFLGRAIVLALLDRGDRVRSFSRGDYPDLRTRGVEVLRGDLGDRAGLRRACEGCDAVFHVAALPGVWGKKSAFIRTNVEGTENVIAACRAAGVRRLIHTSSPSVVFSDQAAQEYAGVDETAPYPERFGCVYSWTKALAEQRVLAAHEPGRLVTTSLRPHLIWGPRDNHLIPRLLARARKGRLIRVGDGSNLVDLTYVDNAALGHLQAADRLTENSPVGGQAYFLSDGKPVILWGWIDRLLREVGLPAVRRSMSHATARRIGAVFELVYSILGIQSEPPMTRFVADQLAVSHHFDIARARSDFGYNPSVDNDTGVQRVVEWIHSART